VIIRRARPDDAPVLARIMGEDDSDHWRALLAEKQRFTAVIDGEDGVPVALVSARPGDLDGEAHLSYLFVEPAAQGRGLGSALHDAALAWMRGQTLFENRSASAPDRGQTRFENRSAAYQQASLRVAVDNDGARRFYEKRGWQQSGQPAFDPFLEREMLDYVRRLSR
jgi:GNAT superfamily N-acetyltransferase